MRFFAGLTLVVVLAPAALAQHQTFAVDPDASEVKMTLKTTHELVNGTFHIRSGSIEFDRGASQMAGVVADPAASASAKPAAPPDDGNSQSPEGHELQKRITNMQQLFEERKKLNANPESAPATGSTSAPADPPQ